MENSKISWTDHTFNPWIGCSKVSAGCENCYAERQENHWGKAPWGPGVPRRLTVDSNWNKPIKWNREAESTGKRPKVFCASMGDIFDVEVSDDWRHRLFALIEKTLNLDWLLLTKRVEVMRDWFLGESGAGIESPTLPNVWLGTTVENQEMADKRVPILCRIPAVKHWLSVEPQLGPVSLEAIPCPHCSGSERIDWIISGGESGPNARPFNLDWARDLRQECKRNRTAFFMKQLGNRPCVEKGGKQIWGLYHGKADVMADWPEDLRVQEFPDDVP